MITRLDNETFDTMLEPSEWRYAAALVGLEKYLKFCGVDYDTTDEALLFYREDITEQMYLKFVEYYYDAHNITMPHKELETKLHQDEFSDEDIKEVNEMAKANTIMKKVFGKTKFDGTNADVLSKMIEENRAELTKETFRNKKNMYANFANTGQLLEEGKDICRLLGYYVDGGRKTKSISFNFDKNTFVAQDDIVFDFIPFAFVGGFETFFINDSYTVRQLIDTNTVFETKIDLAGDGEQTNTKKLLFDLIRLTSDFLDYDVEVVVKSRDRDFFETMFIRKESIEILKEAERKHVNFETLATSIKITDKVYIKIYEEVIDAILNLTRLDAVIELCIKEKRTAIVTQLLKVNMLIRQGGNNMNDAMRGAYACAKEVVKVFEARRAENKIDSYRTKLISAIVAKDYNRFCQILLQLSNYSNVNFGFAYNLFEDFEANKDVAYTFVNALAKQYTKDTATKENK